MFFNLVGSVFFPALPGRPPRHLPRELRITVGACSAGALPAPCRGPPSPPPGRCVSRLARVLQGHNRETRLRGTARRSSHMWLSLFWRRAASCHPPGRFDRDPGCEACGSRECSPHPAPCPHGLPASAFRRQGEERAATATRRGVQPKRSCHHCHLSDHDGHTPESQPLLTVLTRSSQDEDTPEAEPVKLLSGDILLEKEDAPENSPRSGGSMGEGAVGRWGLRRSFRCEGWGGGHMCMGSLPACQARLRKSFREFWARGGEEDEASLVFVVIVAPRRPARLGGPHTL